MDCCCPLCTNKICLWGLTLFCWSLLTPFDMDYNSRYTRKRDVASLFRWGLGLPKPSLRRRVWPCVFCELCVLYFPYIKMGSNATQQRESNIRPTWHFYVFSKKINRKWNASTEERQCRGILESWKRQFVKEEFAHSLRRARGEWIISLDLCPSL